MDTIIFQEVWRRDTNLKTFNQWGTTVVLINEEETQANFNWRHPEANRSAHLATIADKGYKRLIESVVTQFAHVRSNRDMDILDTYRWMEGPKQNKSFQETYERLVESCYSHEMYGSGALNLPRPVIVSDAATKMYVSDGTKVINWDVPETFKAYSFGHELRTNTVAADTFTYRYYADNGNRVGERLTGAPVEPGFYWAEADLPSGAKYYARTETDRYGFTYNAGQQLQGVNGTGTASSARVRGFVRFEIVSETYANLYASVQGETNASAAYKAFAEKAQDEGYSAIANLFLATSDAEAKHAEDEWAILQSMGATERPVAAVPVVGTTAENLKTAFDGETYEYTVMYPGFIKTAESGGVANAARIFNLAMRAEEVHAGNYADMIDNFANIAYQSKTFGIVYRCPVCGEVVSARPGRCPICGANGAVFEKYRMTFTITSININAPVSTTVLRGTTYKFEVILNDNAIDEDIVWTTASPVFAVVNGDGSVTIQNKTGTTLLTATDPVSKLSSSIVLRIV
jgi:rubrerythrin